MTGPASRSAPGTSSSARSSRGGARGAYAGGRRPRAVGGRHGLRRVPRLPHRPAARLPGRGPAFGIGLSLQGGQAEYVCVPNADTTLLPMDGIDAERALLLTDAAATAWFGLSRADVPPGGSVAVVGLGPIGLIGVELAFLMGAAQVFARSTRWPRGATRRRRWGLSRSNPAARRSAPCSRRPAGAGRDSVFEASGASAAIASVLPLTAPGGTASFVGLPQPADALSMQLLLFKKHHRARRHRAGAGNVARARSFAARGAAEGRRAVLAPLRPCPTAPTPSPCSIRATTAFSRSASTFPDPESSHDEHPRQRHQPPSRCRPRT